MAVRAHKAHETTFLNVDLLVEATSPLTPLVEALAAVAHPIHEDRQGRRWTAVLELNRQPTDAARAIARLLDALASLPRPVRALWNGARKRDLDVGIQAGHEPHAFVLVLPPALLARTAAAGARLILTLYACP